MIIIVFEHNQPCPKCVIESKVPCFYCGRTKAQGKTSIQEDQNSLTNLMLRMLERTPKPENK